MNERAHVQLQDVSKTFRSHGTTVKAVDKVNLTFETGGRTIGIVGESGSGKSTLARMVVGLHAQTSGSISFDGNELSTALRSRTHRLRFRRRVQFIAQDTTSSFDPRRSLRDAVRLPVMTLEGLNRQAADERVDEILEMMGLPVAFADRRPHEVSGGQRQRFAIARGLIVRPRLLVCDEVVSALDVSVQGSILNLLKRYCADNEAGLLFVSHGLPATAFLSDELLVMFKGRVVDRGTTDEILGDGERHPYTEQLLAAVFPATGGRGVTGIGAIDGSPTGEHPVDEDDQAAPGGSSGPLQALKNQRWWAGRAAALPLHIAIFAVVVFFLVRAIPGDPVLIVTGGQITPEIYPRVQHSLGLDGSLLSQLGNFYSSLAHLDLGTSMLSGRSVGSELATRFPATLELALMGVIAVVVVSVAGSFLAVMRPTWVPSRIIRGYARTAGAIPEFCVGITLIVVFYAQLQWVPAPVGRIDPFLSQPPVLTGMPFIDSLLRGRWDVTSSMAAHLVLPILVMVIAQSAVLIRLLISGLDESMDAPATRFRIASGASRRTVVLSMLRRALPSAVTMVGIIFGYLLGGAVILESLFGFTGMGQYLVEGVNSKDLPVMQGFLIVTAVVSLTVFFLVDITNMVLDPRRRPGVSAEGS